jgi:pre-mRNA-processing factor 40
MNSVAPPFGQPPPAQVWQEHRTPDGRSYYYNTLTKATQWTKPEDLMTPAEVCASACHRDVVDAANLACLPQRALANQPWKEYTAEGGRKYWYNTETKQSSWEMPDVYKKALGISDSPT